MRNTIELRNGLPIRNGGHILYVFNDHLSYIENLKTFVMDGIKLGHRVLIIDKHIHYQEVKKSLQSTFSKEELENVFFEESGTFYTVNGDFQSGTIAEHFMKFIDSLPHEELKIRTWSRVYWEEQEDIVNNLNQNEKKANELIQDQSILSVCAYDSQQVSGELMIGLLKNHDYFMTDQELIRSQLYIKPKHGVVFPSLSALSKIESEIDFYKRKLDFVHVVSHEVRNPLTIVKAYANLLQLTEPNLKPESHKKLQAIEQYVQIIDQELTHIIETEQMLSNELYVKMELVSPKDVIHEVNELMSIKAAVQNVSYVYHILVSEEDQMLGNLMGLRLILSNLISNAIKYTEEKGEVIFSAITKDRQMELVIKDNGMGMTSKELNSLFEKYGKLNESKSGQGIGLYIVKNLIDQFNGTIHYESQLGSGTKVTVNIPLV